MQAEALKIKLIQKIVSQNDTSQLEKLNQLVEQMWSTDKEDILIKLAKPMRKKLTIEDLVKEQSYQPIDKKAFFKKLDDLNIEEPIEELLKMI